MSADLSDRVSRFVEDVAAWARGRPDIEGLLLVGSHARGQAKADSDVDLVILAPKGDAYLDDIRWTESFGHVERYQREDWGKVTSLRVWYAGGLEVEYGVTDPSWAVLPLDAGTRRVLADGARILLDRRGLLSAALKA